MESSEFLRKIQRFQRHSGTYVAEYNYRTVSSFIAGIDYAADGVHLQDFRNWLLEKYQLKSPFGWSRLVEQIYYDSLSRNAGESVVDFLFASIYEYLRGKAPSKP